jgi:uncharacterized membrane protein YidH (DUF202 family)
LYTTLLLIHSYWRWLALGATVAAVAVATSGWAGKRPWTPRARLAGVIFVAALDLQFLLGLALYGLSPFTRAAMASMGTAMKDPHLRFWLVEHGPLMFGALAAAHIAWTRSKHAPDDRQRYKRMAIGAVIALVLMLVAIPWPGRVVGRPLFR